MIGGEAAGIGRDRVNMIDQTIYRIMANLPHRAHAGGAPGAPGGQESRMRTRYGAISAERTGATVTAEETSSICWLPR